MSKTKPKIIAFDWDNTLVDTWPVICHAYNITRKHFDLDEWDYKTIKSNIGGSLRDVFPKMFGDKWLEAKDIYLSAFEEIHINELKALPDAKKMLEIANDISDYVVVVSNKTDDFLQKEISHLDWDKYIDFAAGAGVAERDKPDSLHMSYVFENIGFSCDFSSFKEKIWYVGDSSVDFEFAKNIGAYSILYNDKSNKNNELKDIGFNYIVSGAKDFSNIYKKNSRKS